MHRFMRAIGFSELNRKELQKLVTGVIMEAEDRAYTSLEDDSVIASFSKEVAPGVGLTVVGEFDENDQFTYDYYFPYVRADMISTEEDLNVERHAATESYAGVFEDARLSISVIFYLQNMIPYVKALRSDMLPMKGTTLSLSALSTEGVIIMPLQKSFQDVVNNITNGMRHTKLVISARNGDEEAAEDLNLKDMDTYTTLAEKIKTEDVFSLVDTCFMPFGVECDQYSIVGEIVEVSEKTNTITGEIMYVMNLMVNDINMMLSVNKKDVLGEPLPGRRYKGNIWLQGKINFPE